MKTRFLPLVEMTEHDRNYKYDSNGNNEAETAFCIIQYPATGNQNQLLITLGTSTHLKL